MRNKKVVFVEPPRRHWFVMGEYVPPPTTLLTLAAYLEREMPELDIEVIDSQGEGLDWTGLRRRMESAEPSVVLTSGFTCNAYTCARTVETAKTIDPDITTVVGGIHFTFTPDESLASFPEIDYIVRGEGELTLVKLMRALRKGKDGRKVALAEDEKKEEGSEAGEEDTGDETLTAEGDDSDDSKDKDDSQDEEVAVADG